MERKSRDKFRLRVLSYNIHQGLTIHKRNIALSMLKEALMSLKADIVLLQEVAGIHGTPGKKKRDQALHRHAESHRARTADARAPEVDEPPDEAVGLTSFQLEALADEIWPYYAYGRNAVFSGGFHGNAILSRYPIRKWENLDISVKGAKPGIGKMLPKRGLLHAAIELPDLGVEAHVMGTHFGLLQSERHAQLQLLCRYVKDTIPAGSPFLVAGDFNDWREHISKKLQKALRIDEAYLRFHRRHARTFPARFPLLCLDRIYFRDLDLEGAARLDGRPWQFLSDHLPLMADFSLPALKK